ncbi:MoxR family ATPase [Citricoccus alkalitolerans]|uniref:MoxR family ATPase n=1 Tax=Citricoccus alkalitolerans TaxID=246603 RepID=A0ABV8Y122_9MICC
MDVSTARQEHEDGAGPRPEDGPGSGPQQDDSWAPGGARLTTTTRSMLDAMDSVVDGKHQAVRTALLVLLAGGHLLVEDVPGVGKTLLARALARTVAGKVNRIQFTPDLLPGDVTGVSVFNQDRHTFEFRPGAVFANIVIGDEINRASAKTQSALLECMEEHQVTVDGTTHRLEEPFMVVATQNPVESEGTYPLPEAQRDRFMARITMGYPGPEAELQMLRTHQGPLPSSAPVNRLAPVTTTEEVLQMIEAVSRVHVSEAVARYVIDLGRASREHPDVLVGASPRSLLQLLRAAKAEAAISGRSFTTPQDVAGVVPVVFPHRLMLRRRSTQEAAQADATTQRILHSVPVPAGL